MATLRLVPGDQLSLTLSSEWRLLEKLKPWDDAFDCDVELRDDDRFLCSETMFRDWADGRK